MKSFGCKLCRVISIPFTVLQWLKAETSTQISAFFHSAADEILTWFIDSFGVKNVFEFLAAAACMSAPSVLLFSHSASSSASSWMIFELFYVVHYYHRKIGHGIERIAAVCEGWNLNSSCNLNVFSSENTLNSFIRRFFSRSQLFQYKTTRFYIHNN